MKKKMKKFSIKDVFKNILNNIETKYIDVIRGSNSSFFTRTRKVSPKLIFLQMFFNTAKSYKNELDNFYSNISLPNDISTWGFIKQRLKFNPQAILVIIKDFLRSFYEESGKAIELLGYIILAIDGSDFTVPTTEENKKHFGEHKGIDGIHAAMAKMSAIYDCISNVIINIQVNTYKYAEVKLAEDNLDAMRNVLGKDRKKIIIFDRAYASLKLIFNMIDHNEKFLFRLNSTHFKKEQISMKSNDEWIDIIFDRARLNQFRTDFYFVERLLNLKKLNLRFVKVPIETPDGEVIDEYLLTNLENDVFDLDSLKHLYHMRWNIETSYRMLKSNLKLEDFTGKKPTVVYQDIYISTFVFNITQVIIIEANEKYKFKQENHKYEKKVNNNYAFGTVKTNFIKVLFEKGIKKSNQMMEDLLKSISNTRVPIRDNRSFSRDRTPVNKCRMSYKYSY